MASITYATITISTKEAGDNTFIYDWFSNLGDKANAIRSISLLEDKMSVIVDYTPLWDFDVYDLVESLSKEFSNTFVTLGHCYGNMQLTTTEYIVVYKDGEIIFEEDYPLLVFEEDGEMDDDGGYPIDQEATKLIQEKFEKDKKEWFASL